MSKPESELEKLEGRRTKLMEERRQYFLVYLAPTSGLLSLPQAPISISPLRYRTDMAFKQTRLAYLSHETVPLPDHLPRITTPTKHRTLTICFSIFQICQT